MKKKLLIVIAGLMLAITHSFATGVPTVYTDETAFKAALQSPYYLETFSDLSEGNADSVPRSSGDYKYNITSYCLGNLSSLYNWQYVVGASDYRANLIINNTGTSINAIGGNFYLTNDALAYTSGDILIVAGTDTINVTPTSASSFIGIVFPQTVSKVYVISKNQVYGTYVSFSNLYVGKTTTISATAGSHSYDVSSLGFANADIVKLTAGSDSTDAVVVDGKIEFYAPSAGIYSVIKKSTVAKSTKAGIGPVTVEEYAGGVNDFGQYKGVGDYVGTANRPLTGLSHFIGIGATQTGNVSSSWKQANTYAGYSWFGDAVATRGKCYILAEDRNETTGKLLASLYFDPTISEVGSQEVMGPHAYNFIFNPTDAIISTALASHSVYSGSPKRQAEALDSVVAVRDADTSMVLANVGFMRAFSTKAKTYTFDIATISNNKFVSGDVLELKYLLGSNDHTIYHSPLSTAPAAIAALEANAQAQVSKDTVDANGYVTFNIYGGGFFSLTKKVKSTTGIENASSTFTISSTGNTITVSAEAGAKVSVFDLTGKQILSNIMSAEKASYTMESKGIYIVKVCNDKDVITQKCMIK